MENTYGEFVKMTDLKDCVNEICLPLLESIRVREEEHINTRNCINVIFNDLKSMQQISRQAILLKGNVHKVNKHLERLD